MDAHSETTWLIVGLGNPGPQYERTRHNLGFMVVDLLAREAGVPVKREECRALIGRAEIENVKAELVKPQTYMNLTGESLNCLLKKPDRTAGKMIVISDDLALPVGTIRLRAKGSAGGHNGLKSIINCLGTNEFIRLRIGIMPDHPLANTKNFVLENFAKGEIETVEKVLEKSARAIRSVLDEGIEKSNGTMERGYCRLNTAGPQKKRGPSCFTPTRVKLENHKEEIKLANRVYEVMYIIDPDASDENVAKLNEAVGKLIEKEGGTIVRMDDIGIRRLAYPIKKKTEGYYVLFEIEGSGQEIAELERRMRVNDMIFRYVTVRVDEDRKKADKIQAKRDRRSSKRSKFRQTEETAGAASDAS